MLGYFCTDMRTAGVSCFFLSIFIKIKKYAKFCKIFLEKYLTSLDLCDIIVNCIIIACIRVYCALDAVSLPTGTVFSGFYLFILTNVLRLRFNDLDRGI